MKLLDTTGGNTKLRKNNRDVSIRAAGLSLTPDDSVCPMRHIAGCAKSCLVHAGRGHMPSVINGRQSKLDYWHSDRPEFLNQLVRELSNFEKLCAKTNVKPYVRLNVVSDIAYEKKAYGQIPQQFPNISMYDYTKQSNRLGKLPANYRLMFSYSPAPEYQDEVRVALDSGVPMSAVFYPELPDVFLGRRVIDGDISDIRNLDHAGCIVGLRYKNANGQGVNPMDETFVVKTINLSKAA